MTLEKDWCDRIEQKMDQLATAVTTLAQQEVKIAHSVERQDRLERWMTEMSADIYGKDGLMVRVARNMAVIGAAAVIISTLLSVALTTLAGEILT